MQELPSQDFDLAPDDSTLRISQVLSGRYRIDAILSKGGLGTVYRGEHVHMRKQLAIKVLHPETKEHPHLVARFEREAIAGAHIHHPNVAAATDFGQRDDGAYFLITEFVPGRPLHDLIRQGPMPQRRAALIAKQIAAGLAACHAVGIAHRDLKPANVMIVEQAGDLAKLIDFGFARIDFNRLSLPDSGTPGKPHPPSLTTGTMIFGTPVYMAPETVGGMSAVDHRSDLYALGVILFEMLTGERPFEEPQVVRLLRRKNQEPAPNVSQLLGPHVVSPELEAITAKLLERAPEDRFASAQKVVEAIDNVIASLPETLPRQPAAPSSAEIEFGPTQEISVPSGENAPSGKAADASIERPTTRQRWSIVAVLGAITLGVVALALWIGRGAQPLVPLPPVESASAAPTLAAAPSAPGPAMSAEAWEPPAPPDSTNVHSSPDRSNELRAEVWRAYAQKRWKAGAEALLDLITEDPSVLGEPDMADTAAAVVAAADNVDVVLAGKVIDALGQCEESSAVDVLYEIVRTTGAARRAGKRAVGWLKREDVRNRATPPARLAIELRLAGCAQKRPLFARAASEGDERALVELQALFAMRCGRRKPGPCCFKKDPALTEALSALSARLGKK